MKLSQIFDCRDDSDVSPLHRPTDLYLKPMSKINITIHFPQLKQSIPTGGTNVSSWGIMEKLKALVSPDQFISIKTVKNTLEFILFEGDLENRSILKGVIGRLDGKKLKVTGIKEPLKILASETKLKFPSKYDWDTFFRDAHHMNEMKPGERPDTIHIQNLPTEWFSSSSPSKATPKNKDSAAPESLLPSARVFTKVWERYGEIRMIDIPMLDPYRSKIKTSLQGMKTFNFNVDKVFEAYIQYKEYLGFVKAMDALRGAFLVKKDEGKLLLTAIKVDFDNSMHLSEDVIKQRKIEIEKVKTKEAASKLIEKGNETKSTGKKISESSSSSSSGEKEKLLQDSVDIDRKIAMEERKYLVARRKLEAIRLMDFLFERLKAKQALKEEAATKKRKRKKSPKKKKSEPIATTIKHGRKKAKTEKDQMIPAWKMIKDEAQMPRELVTVTPAAAKDEVMKSKTDEMRDRLLKARKMRTEEARLRELAVKSLKRARSGYAVNATNRTRP